MSSVPCSNNEDITPSEPAIVKLDSLFIFYANNDPKHMPVRFLNMKFPVDKVFMNCKSGKRLDDLVKTMYEDRFDLTTADGLSRYDCFKITFYSFGNF